MKTEIKTVRKIVLKTGHKIIYSYFKKKMSFIKVKDPRKREELIRDFIETRKRIKDNFIAKKVGEIEYQTGLTKLFKPVTETQKATAKEITEAQKAATEKITQELLPIKEGKEGLNLSSFRNNRRTNKRKKLRTNSIRRIRIFKTRKKNNFWNVF